MKKQGILNSPIANVLSSLGHTDTIVIADCGLPIPDGVQRIDVSLKKGFPSFYETLEIILEDMEVEKITLAHEIKEKNAPLHEKLQQTFSTTDADYVSHEEFKALTKKAKAIIRTGEITPYANIILHSGVIF